jgi:hypothetical protein
VTSVQSDSELNTSTSETAGSAASPSVTFASGTPSSTLFAKIPPIAKIDWRRRPIRKIAHAASARARRNDQANRKEGDEQARVDARFAREIAHQPKQQASGWRRRKRSG